MLINEDWISDNVHLFFNKNIVIITGAGISVQAGIPDFRSKTGIFKDIKKKYKIKGQDLFTYKFGLEPSTRKIYLEYISQFKSLVEKAEPTKTHKNIKWLELKSNKIRVYTQNIDGLEEKAGLDKSLIYLHGNLKFLKCLTCGYLCNYTSKMSLTLNKEVECMKCLKESKDGKLRQKKGYLHTNIIHYYQDHPDSDKISECIKEDSDCDLLIVVGTSMNVFGVKNMVKYFGRMENIVSIYVNISDCHSSMKKYFTHFYIGSSDSFFEYVKRCIVELELNTSIQDISLLEDETSYLMDASVIQENIQSSLIKSDRVESKLLRRRKRLSLTKEGLENSFLRLLID